MKPTKRDQAVECMHVMEEGMIKTGTTRDMWQNNLVWWICRAIMLLLEDYISRRKQNGV